MPPSQIGRIASVNKQELLATQATLQTVRSFPILCLRRGKQRSGIGQLTSKGSLYARHRSVRDGLRHLRWMLNQPVGQDGLFTLHEVSSHEVVVALFPSRQGFL